MSARREIFKFLCGFLAGAGVVHANLGFAIAAGMISQPHYLGRTWGASSLWLGAAAYLVASVVLGYLGWRSSHTEVQTPEWEKSRT